MKPSRLQLMIALMCVGLFGVYWAVGAQEGRLFAPPALPTTAADKKEPTKFPHTTQPLRDKAKPDPTLIVPAAVYEEPRPLPGENGSNLVQTQAVAPPPAFPPPMVVLEPKIDKIPAVLPPLPMVEPAPIVDPTRVLIVEPTTKEISTKKPSLPEMPLQPPPAIILPVEDKKPSLPAIIMPVEDKKPSLPLPEIAPPMVMPELNKAPTPPVNSMPIVTQPEPTPIQKPRAFVRIESAANQGLPPVIGLPPLNLNTPNLESLAEPFKKKISPSPVNASDAPSLQTPHLQVLMQGARFVRANEPQTVQFVVRNLGPVAAQQVRIEEDLPANVKILSADPMPVIQGNQAVWTLSNLNVNQEQILRLTVQSTTDAEMPGRMSVHVGVTTAHVVARPRNDKAPLAVQVTGPTQVAVGKTATFEIRVSNPSAQALTGFTLFGYLPDGLSHPEGSEIKAALDDLTIAAGETKTLKMPATAVKAGRFTVGAKVVSGAGEASVSTPIEITAEGMQLHQAPATRLFLGRDGELRIEVTNNTAKPLRNVDVADRLPEGLDFLGASDLGLYQGNSRTVFWHINELPVGTKKSLVIQVSGKKAGQLQNVVFAKADGVAEMQSAAVVALEGQSDLILRVVDRHNPLELGKETVYEILVQNRGTLYASSVQLQVQFPAGVAPTKAEGNTKFLLTRQSVVFEPIASLPPQGQAIFRVSAVAQAVGDQRVRFAIVSDQVRVPIDREISTKVVP